MEYTNLVQEKAYYNYNYNVGLNTGNIDVIVYFENASQIVVTWNGNQVINGIYSGINELSFNKSANTPS